jgi:hypothetical protein
MGWQCAWESPCMGRRRWRLTLALQPWAAALRGEEKAEVRLDVFADSDDIEGGMAKTNEELSAARWESHGCSSVGSS